MKKLLALICFLALLSSALAFHEILADETKTEFLKGETIPFEGACPAEKETVMLSALAQEKKVFSFDLNCLEGRFSFPYPVSFLDPAGEWQLSLDALTEKKLNILPSRESQFLLVKFLSPTRTLTRTDDINIIVEITDAGRPLLDANVIAWDVQGKKIRLAHKGDGAYIVSTSIPFNADLGTWDLAVTAARPGAGGESRQNVKIEPADIVVEFLEPRVSVFSVDGEIPVEVKATYLNGGPLNEPYLELHVIGESLENYLMKQTENNTYAFVYDPSEQAAGTQVLSVVVTDGAENKAEASKEIVLVKDFSWYIKRYYWLPMIILAVLGLFYLMTRSILRQRLESKTLKAKQKNLEHRIKRLQENYFSGQLSKNTYKQEVLKLEKELSAVKQDLRLRKPSPQKSPKKKKRK